MLGKRQNQRSDIIRMKISQIKLTMNRGGIVRDCFAHNESLPGRKPDEIVWMDNGSTDGTAEFAQEHSDICVLNRKNLGMAYAFNRAFALATGDMILMLGAYCKAPNGY